MHHPLRFQMRKFVISSSISCIFVILTQLGLTLIPLYFASFSLLSQLSLSAILLLVITGLGNGCRRLLRFYASAPAFVFFNILFIWGIYVIVIQKEIPLVWNFVFNVECVLIIFGFNRILFSDPGLVAHGDATLKELIQNEVSGVKSQTEEEGLLKLNSCIEQPVVEMEEAIPSLLHPSLQENNPLPMRRIRHCKFCKAYIRGFDHHCPAFGNCIGQKNHVQFMALIVGFVMVEASYFVFSTHFITKSRIMDKAMLESNLFGYLAISTRSFSILQVLWQFSPHGVNDNKCVDFFPDKLE